MFDLCNGDIANACKCMLSGPSFESLVSLLSSAVLTKEEERVLKTSQDEQEGDNLEECVLSFYKGPRFAACCYVQVCLSGQPAIDTGGIRRQVYLEAFERIAFSDVQWESCAGGFHRRRKIGHDSLYLC